jgi:hypothetical protein
MARCVCSAASVLFLLAVAVVLGAYTCLVLHSVKDPACLHCQGDDRPAAVGIPTREPAACIFTPASLAIRTTLHSGRNNKKWSLGASVRNCYVRNDGSQIVAQFAASHLALYVPCCRDWLTRDCDIGIRRPELRWAGGLDGPFANLASRHENWRLSLALDSNFWAARQPCPCRTCHRVVP